MALLQMDRFYNTLPHDKAATAHNFDVPDAFDWPLFVDTLQKLSTGQSVQVPRYSFETHQRLKELDTFEGAEVILVEGILTLHDPRVHIQTCMQTVAQLREGCGLSPPRTFLRNVTG